MRYGEKDWPIRADATPTVTAIKGDDFAATDRAQAQGGDPALVWSVRRSDRAGGWNGDFPCHTKCVA